MQIESEGNKNEEDETKKKNEKKDGEENLEVEEEDEKKLDLPEESKVGKKLTDLTTKRTIVLVLSLLLAIILFNPDFYLTTLTAMDFGLKIFNEFQSINDPNLKLCFDLYVNQFKVKISDKLFKEYFKSDHLCKCFLTLPMEIIMR